MQSSPSTPAFKNIVDSPYCTCGDIEESHHFLFVCYQFTELRFGSESVHMCYLVAFKIVVLILAQPSVDKLRVPSGNRLIIENRPLSKKSNSVLHLLFANIIHNSLLLLKFEVVLLNGIREYPDQTASELIRLLLQKQSDLVQRCLSRPFWLVKRVQNFIIFTGITFCRYAPASTSCTGGRW